jgi:hypothetical protein
MKIVKSHKNRTAHSEFFGVWAGKTLLDQEVDIHATLASHGGVNDQIHHVKVGNGDAFIWFDDMEEVRRLGAKLTEHYKEWFRRLPGEEQAEAIATACDERRES